MKETKSSLARVSSANLIGTVLATAVITLFSFPVISYTSVVLYGFPAAAYLLAGYLLWLFVNQRNPRLGFAFAIGFVPIVTFCVSRASGSEASLCAHDIDAGCMLLARP
jgi:hypothetical protein